MKNLSALLFILSIPFSANAGYLHQSQTPENCATGVFMNYMKSQIDVTSFKLSAKLSERLYGLDKVRYGSDYVVAWINGEIKERGQKSVKIKARVVISYESNKIVDKLGRTTLEKNYSCYLNSFYATHDQSGQSWFQVIEPNVVNEKVDIIN